ncbi:juvenile hormone esterase-like isoform X2 [Anticarsia gemmatalis]
MVQVSVSDGLLEGEVIQNEYGGTYCSFKGIPYAEPPIGDLRFKAPQPPKPWAGTRSAKEFGPVCHQFNFMYPDLHMSEDCLYINVYTPDTKPHKPLPVMVWIHGGGFAWGSGNDDWYGPQFLIRLGVILVTFNYRLEALGFLCLDTPDIPGNAGMKDQVAALRWVKKNIANFGGDPNNITIFGESAGAASVAFHLVSPMTKGLFNKAITQSGAATSWWSRDFASAEKTLLLAKQLGCFSENIEEVTDFFKKQPLDTLVHLRLHVSKNQKSYEISFGIADEKDFGQERFFYGDATDVTRRGIHEGVEVMTGYTQDEGLMAIAVGGPFDNMIKEASFFVEFFVPKFIKTHCVIADQLAVGRIMRDFYFKNGVSKEAVLRFMAADMFLYDIIFAGKLYSQKNKVYFYKFTCQSERNFMGHRFGFTDVIADKKVVCHADDLPYLFPIKAEKGKVNEKSKEFQLIDRVTKLWTNFAKCGNPTQGNMEVEWRPYTLQKQEYLDIGRMEMASKPDGEEIEFWQNIFKQYIPKYTI